MWKTGLLLLAIHSISSALDGPEAAFDTFKHLQGKWAIQSEGKTLSFEMTYDIGSNGSIVTEQFGKELSVIYRDGADLLMTHFYNRGNAPRLKLQQNSQPGTFAFEMFDIKNLKSPGTPHVQKVIYRFIDDNHIALEIVWQEGKSQDSEKYLLTKI